GTVPGPITPGTFDYIIGIPTAVMPNTGTATYSLMGYTSPTSTDGTTGYGVSGNLNVNFSTLVVGVNLNIANAANSYTVNDTTATTISGSTFSGSLLSTTSSTGSCGGACGCATSVSGFFAGANASRAGLSYTLNNGTANIQGVAAFAKQ
ncbi:MAG TPA: hypothetical protein VFQ99_03940, partial [Gallionella sp.]|nr:hypothetical protein [Gallionella sp.]